MRRLAPLVLLLGLIGPGAGIGQAQTVAPARPARFLVGTAVRDINPTKTHPQYLGGFDQMPKPTSNIHDPLQVRAFVVAQGHKVVAFAIADIQGWFAGNQEGPYGVSDARQHAASALAKRFPGTTEADIIVSSTHSHAAPTVMGIWGPTDVWYLKRLHDQTVAAIAAAAASLRPAELWTASGDVGAVNGSNVSQTDIYDGWYVDGDAPVLWARDPSTHATIGVYANIPIHADVTNGADLPAVSADHIGVERSSLDALLGGTAVVAMGTLGRQESMVQVGGPDEAENVGTYVTRQLLGALARAKPLSDATLASAEQYIVVPGTNPALLALVALNAVKFTCTSVACTIDRSLLPPYLVGTAVGTWVTTLRIGNLLYVSQPGEAFPEVSRALRESVPGAVVRPVGMAQDQLGYYWPVEDAPFTTVLNDSDHLIFNSSGELADLTAAAALANAQALGFAVVPVRPTAGVVDPLAHLNPGIQFFAIQSSGADRSVYLDAATNRGYDDAPLVGDGTDRIVHWTFGDGTTGLSKKSTTHTYARPGRYTVTAMVTDTKGRTRAWKHTVTVTPPLRLTLRRYGDLICPRITGGDGTLLDEVVAYGRYRRHHSGWGLTAPHAHSAVVTVLDGAGNRASARVGPDLRQKLPKLGC